MKTINAPLISPGILASSLEFFQIVKRYDIKVSQFFLSCPNIKGTSLAEVINTSKACSWIILEDEKIRLTDSAYQYEAQDIKNSMRSMLFDYIKTIKPAWSALLTKGRFESVPFLPKDVQACFYDLELMIKPPSKKVISWWDQVQVIFYADKQISQMLIGRQGEGLSMKYERERTGIVPIWQSVESNLLGYDILSRVSDDDSAPLLIEVKASNVQINDASAFITKHEWETAIHSKNYFFHFWLLSQSKVAVLPVELLLPDIPANQGGGEWEIVNIPFSMYEDKFIEYLI